ncbi:ParB family protein [Leifsonia xyli]|uniref:ParB family protein n=1 Tax=Leifsonia xyli TaxID=1575 RepID=UPI0002F11061|nr:hypothetical protein [Leifsonia xyli]
MNPNTEAITVVESPASAAPASSEFRVAPTTVAGTTTTAKRTTITFYLSEGLRNRARAAYRSTSFEEKDSSWSEMLNKALLAEVERREAAYNDGEKFTGTDEPLSPGRPIGF